MFVKILIANRGAIACRIIRTLRRMNIISVAIYAQADHDSLHVEQADEAFSLGEGAAAATYLNQEKILSIAKKCGAQAIHPGYGFLSENASFVQLCREHGITFIGPSVENMRQFSLKHNARELANAHAVPLIPGSGVLNDLDEAVTEAQRIGFPLMLKSSAGGGGIGMQVCYSESDLKTAYESVVRLSENNFADGRVFLEKYIEQARHIEIQVFGDGQGRAVDLGERDCSLQRRNQKVIEEAPAPNLDPDIKALMCTTATRLLSGVKYESAGTVEFIFDSTTQAFFFLEVNTRLQVEHGVTEAVYGVDLVEWMIEQAHAPIEDLIGRRKRLRPQGHAIQARIYAENPCQSFQPSAGLLSEVNWPTKRSVRADNQQDKQNVSSLRIDTWVTSGCEVSPFFDPMLAKVIVWEKERSRALSSLHHYLGASQLYGVTTNTKYVQKVLRDPVFEKAQMYTRYLETWQFDMPGIEVLSPGTMTTIQDLPGRIGYWEVGVPPSGPFDGLSFRLGNQALGNNERCAGLEITVSGPQLKFYAAARVLISGAPVSVRVDGNARAMWEPIDLNAGQVLSIGKISTSGARAYLLIAGGIQCPDYLGAKSTFTLGQFGGHAGRALKTGDVIEYGEYSSTQRAENIDKNSRPHISDSWLLNVIYGPHGAPDFFTEDDIKTFFAAQWEVHYNSSRTGIRLVGPKPQWARETGGEAGMHPSNIHDNAYAFGTVDFTGDMPVILGPDGPSLGGFVCPATVIKADLWKLGQMRAGDKVRFNPVSISTALTLEKARITDPYACEGTLETEEPTTCILKTFNLGKREIVIRPAGDRFILIEFGEQQLDLQLRFQVYALQAFLQDEIKEGIIDLTPGIRSLQIHYDPHLLSLEKLVQIIEDGASILKEESDVKIPSRIVYLPLSWDDKACHDAVEKYMQSVRENAPWCPSNIEFIRRINGLTSVEDVKKIIFDASYVVMGLGDVYLGAPVATPLDPRHRLVTTKYNPARTWTAENSVGIGGAYLCIYGMEGPGGYQFIGRTLQMWNRYKKTAEFSKPWLLRFFDQIRFYEVSHDELCEIRQKFPLGNYTIRIEDSEFSLRDYSQFLLENQSEIDEFKSVRQAAFNEELQRWRDSGQFHFDSSQSLAEDDVVVPDGLHAIESHVAGSVWKVAVMEEQKVVKGQVLLILESMKMEIEIVAQEDCVITSILKQEGSVVSAGQALIYIEEKKS